MPDGRWDSDRVRIELCDVMSVSFGAAPQMAAKQAAEIWLSDDDGRVKRTRKPAFRLVAESRPELLRQLATWIEEHEDAALLQLAAEYARQAAGGPRPQTSEDLFTPGPYPAHTPVRKQLQ